MEQGGWEFAVAIGHSPPCDGGAVLAEDAPHLPGCGADEFGDVAVGHHPSRRHQFDGAQHAFAQGFHESSVVNGPTRDFGWLQWIVGDGMMVGDRPAWLGGKPKAVVR